VHRLLLLLICIGASALGLSADILPLNNTWTVLDQTMSTGDFFSGVWTWSSSNPVDFVITDLLVVGDQFNVYDFGTLVATTPSVAPWFELPDVIDPFQSPPFTDNPDQALASADFSSAELLFGPGDHSITIQDINIPLDNPGGVPFPDGTVAFKASDVPEPSSLMMLFTATTISAFRIRSLVSKCRGAANARKGGSYV
jgi:hypothetical protein